MRTSEEEIHSTQHPLRDWRIRENISRIISTLTQKVLPRGAQWIRQPLSIGTSDAAGMDFHRPNSGQPVESRILGCMAGLDVGQLNNLESSIFDFDNQVV